jgi:hypothetical protein
MIRRIIMQSFFKPKEVKEKSKEDLEKEIAYLETIDSEEGRGNVANYKAALEKQLKIAEENTPPQSPKTMTRSLSPGSSCSW